jgi:hypothetical protein
MIPAVVALALLTVWGASSRPVRERLLSLIDVDSRVSSTQSATGRVVAFFLFLALLTVLNPEVRIFLLFIDTIGIDVFLLLVLFQLQTGFVSIHTWAESLWRRMCGWGPMPFHWPTLTTLRRHPVMAVCAASPPLVALVTLLSMSFFAYILVRTAVELHA